MDGLQHSRFQGQVRHSHAPASLGITGSGAVLAQDRLAWLQPVTAKKPYRIAYGSADMNADFFLALAYGVLDEAQRSGVQVVRVLSAGGYGKVAEQIAQLEELNTLIPDAVILVSTAFDGFRQGRRSSCRQWHQSRDGGHADQLAQGVAGGHAERTRHRKNGSRLYL